MNLSETETPYLEVHPFPEWVIKIFQPLKKPGKAYALIPLLEKKFIEKILGRKNFSARIEKIQTKISEIKPEEIIAVEYCDGMCIKIPPNVPHYFISAIQEGEDVPFMEVFEPKIDFLKLGMGFDTPYFNLPFKLCIK